MKKSRFHTYFVCLAPKKPGLILFLLFPLFLHAQTKETESPKNLKLEGRFYYGFLNNYHNELKLFNAHIPAFELSLLKPSTGKQEWEKRYKYPTLGLGFFYTPFNGTTALGSAYGLYPHLSFPLIKKEKQQLLFRIGLGLAYLSSTFDPIDNYENLAIGSSINALVHFMLHYNYQLSTYAQLSAGISLVHFSNGSISTPNYGLNLPLISLGYIQRFTPAAQQKDLTPYPLFKKERNRSFRFDIQMGYGIKSHSNFLNEKYSVFAPSFVLYKKMNQKSMLGAGIDISWDQSYKALLEGAGIEPKTGLASAKYGLAANYEMRLHKLSMKLALGTYFYAQDKTEGPVYEKIALNYLVYKNIYAGIELKAHAARAAYISWGLGYQLPFTIQKP